MIGKRLKIFLDHRYLAFVQSNQATTPEEMFSIARFNMLLHSSTELHLNQSMSEFIELTKSNPMYRILMSKRNEGQVNIHFDVTQNEFKEKHAQQCSVSFLLESDKQRVDNMMICTTKDLIKDLSRLFVSAQLKVKKGSSQSSNHYKKMAARVSELKGEKILISDGYLFSPPHKPNYNSKQNLESLLKAVSTNTEKLFINAKNVWDIDKAFSIFKKMANTTFGILNGKEHNRWLVSNFFFITAGNGFDSFAKSGVANRDDEYTINSLFMPKEKPGDDAPFQIARSYIEEIEEQIKFCREGKYDLKLKGNVFFEDE